MGEFEGRAVLVTGGALGIGRGVVRAFAHEGASVAIADVNAEAAGRLRDEIGSDGARGVRETSPPPSVGR